MRDPVPSRWFEVLRCRQVRRFVLAKSVSEFGNWLLAVAIIDALYELTGSPAIVGVWLAIRLFPSIVLTPLAGALVDRWRKQAILVYSSLALGVSVLLYLPFGDAPGIIVVSAGIALVSLLAEPAAYSAMPLLAPPERLLGVNALMGVVSSALLVVGPPAGAVIVARLGIQWAVLLDALSFGIAALLYNGLKIEEPAPAGTSAEQRLVDVLRSIPAAIRSAPGVVPVFRVCLLFLLGASAIPVLLYPYAAYRLELGAQGYGLFLSAIGLGGMFGSGLIAGLGRKRWAPALLAVGAAFSGMLFSVLPLVAIPGIALTLMALHGLSGSVYEASRDTLLQERAPADARGRVFTVFLTLAMCTSLLGTLFWGFAAQALGEGFILSVGGMVMATAGLVGLVWVSGTARATRRLAAGATRRAGADGDS